MYHYDYSFIHRGISLSTFIKPIMAIYAFLLGSYQIPLSSYYIDILFTVYGIMIIYGFYKLLSDHNIYHPIFLAGVLPLIISIFLIEPLSLPAMTQIAPHHILFLFPWLVFIFYYIAFKSKSRNSIITFLCFGTIYASYSHHNVDFINYGNILDKLPSSEVPCY